MNYLDSSVQTRPTAHEMFPPPREVEVAEGARPLRHADTLRTNQNDRRYTFLKYTIRPQAPVALHRDVAAMRNSITDETDCCGHRFRHPSAKLEVASTNALGV
ncbi:hypothetical protein EVAR_97730_1 [Eumeta japonica]|uniref:Uncharacterized protein n=1 Tax=Eumeta variegata TaxID=151549 RepID=A0A4C1X628_EUMVA|nr:hypothetical protein EVAR_97730_1 [Eumeta japonica]